MGKLQRKPLNRSQQLMTITPKDQLNDVRNDSRAMHDVLQDVVVAVDELRDTSDIMMRANDGNVLSEDGTKRSQSRKGGNFINTDDNNDNNNVKYKTGNDKNGNENVNDAQDYYFDDRNTTMKTVITAKTVDSLNAGSNNAVDDADEIDVETKDFDNKSDNDMVNDNVAKWQQDMTAALQQQLIYQFAIKYKQIPRITLFTCRQTLSTEQLPSTAKNMVTFLRRMYSRSGFNLPEIVKPSDSYATTTKSSIPLTIIPNKSRNAERIVNSLMVKIVKIDQLIIKRRPSDTGSPLRRGFNTRSDRPSDRTTFTNANWLDQQFAPSTFKQIAVLDLACGAASRRVLEMASSKALFNTMYHWLLMGDYAFNRQTETDDANDVKTMLNSSNNGSSSSSSSSSRSGNCNNINTIKENKKEVVSNNELLVKVGKKSNPSSSDVGGASTSGCTDTIHSGGGGNQQYMAGVDAGVAALHADDTETIENFLEKLNININTELTLAKRTRIPRYIASSTPKPQYNDDYYSTLNEMDYYKLYDVWNPGLQYGGELNVSAIGNFTLMHGLQLADWYQLSPPVTRRMNMHLVRVRCLVVIIHKNRTDTLEDYLNTHYDTHLDSMNRFNFALLSNVRDLFNFSFILSKTSSWGYLKNGKFDGMIGALVRKQADIGGSPIFFRIERAKVIDYTTRTWVARPCFIFRHPRSTKKDRVVFLQPFTNDVWVYVAIFGIFTILLLWILTTIECILQPEKDVERPTTTVVVDVQPTLIITGGLRKTGTTSSKQRRNASLKGRVVGNILKFLFINFGSFCCGQSINAKKQSGRVGLFLESSLFYVGSICQQGLSFSTHFFSGRCIIVTSLMFSFAIYQFYSASIVGTLLMEKPKTIRTLRDLIHSSLEIGIEDIAYNRDYFLRTKDPVAQELYAKKVTSVPAGENGFSDVPVDGVLPTMAVELSDAAKAKAYRDILHSHETGAHAKASEASNWYDPDFGVNKIKKGRFAFHVDVATAYKIIADTYTEKEICDLTEIQLFPPQKMVSIVQKGSPLRKVITYGLRRVAEAGITDYQRKVWHFPKPRCVKQLHTDDLKVDMQTFTSALLVLIFGYAVSLLILGLEIMYHKLWQRYATT
ncbi:uncharacterized protein LOC119632317 [Glossina fuscipes]|uniref:Uncharacterized protein LOC119632317 n=1 Tax=Glossina fuscipes TaxID=7396 RepID=A0A8U0W7P1_9MUSC|nr:uncharacterized protein LOC119632317 [Glossina fuscipes]